MHSMTGFGRNELSDEITTVTVELSSVNRKQSEVLLNLPKAYSSLEPHLRKLILSKIARGRVNGQIMIKQVKKNATLVALDLEKAEAYEDLFKTLSNSLGRPVILSAGDFIKIPELFTQPEGEPVAASTLIIESTTTALNNLLSMRLKEGADLKADCLMRLHTLSEIHAQILELSPQANESYRAHLLSKLSALDLLNLPTETLMNDERLLKEVALFADRSDITEELTRLSAHLTRFHEYLATNSPVGRQLDFLCQELHRELNTITSKAQSSSIAHLVVTGKTEVEKIREQIQNVE